MITIKNVKGLDNQIHTFTQQSSQDITIDAEGKLTLLPGLIDCHVHLRTPGAEHKENWITGARAAINGGITTVFDMPNNSPACITKQSLDAKKALIESQLQEVGIPLRYELWFGADKDHLDEVGKCKNEIIGIKVYMGSSTGDLVMNDSEALEKTFQGAAQRNLIVAVHAEDEDILTERKLQFAGETNPSVHSKIRDRSAAIKATKEAIRLAEKFSTEVYFCHVSTEEEIELIRQAKRNEILVFAEVTPHHLFLNEEAYEQWGTKVQMNPPLRTKRDQQALWEGIKDGTIDTIASDHAPHTLDEKNLPYGKSPSGVPGLETTLPLLLNAHHDGKISIERIIELMRTNPINIFELHPNDDIVLVDLEKRFEIKNEFLGTKCKWSPFQGQVLKGCPIYTIVKGKLFKVEHGNS
jgi:dihydroorotase